MPLMSPFIFSISFSKISAVLFWIRTLFPIAANSLKNVEFTFSNDALTLESDALTLINDALTPASDAFDLFESFWKQFIGL